MSQCKYISSCGIQFLVVASNAARKVGGNLLLAELGKSAKDILAICNLDQHFPTHADVASAIKSLQ